MLVINSAILMYIIAYGVGLGVRNIILRIYSVFSGKFYNQNNLGKILDGMWITFILYITFVAGWNNVIRALIEVQ